MPNFLAIYTGSATGPQAERWAALDEKTRAARAQAGMLAWQEWVKQNQSSLVAMGGPLGETKRIGPDGITDMNNAISAFTVVRAASHEEAARLFENHPHFAIFPGDSVEVMEVLPIPGEPG